MSFNGYHSEWNLGSPGGWDYQRVTQIIGKAVWAELNRIHPFDVDLDFDHPLLFPVRGFVSMLIEAHRERSGSQPGVIAVVAEEETLEDVAENRNLAKRLSDVDGITGILIAPQELECRKGRVCWRNHPVSILFVDFNTDVLLNLHRRYDLSPLLQAVREKRVINPRGTEPINTKAIFEVLTRSETSTFDPEIVRRTPWTRRFYPRRTEGPRGEPIENLAQWTRRYWRKLVLKPERGYSGKGVRVGGIHDGDEAITLALEKGDYIVQEKIPPAGWAEEIPVVDTDEPAVRLETVQTDFRCLVGPRSVFGFLCRFGGIPTNVGSGGGVQPLAVLRSAELSVAEAVTRINETVMAMDPSTLTDVVGIQHQMALDHQLTYLLGPIKVALRPRIVTPGQIDDLVRYGRALWRDCITLEKMWLSGSLNDIVSMEEEELRIVRWQPWLGSPAIIASDGLFDFGASPNPS